MATLQTGGGSHRWRTKWLTLSTTPTLHSQRAKPSPSWSRLIPETRIGRGLARIAQILWGKAPWGVGIACPPPRTPRRGAAQEGEEVEGATPLFLPLVRHRGVFTGAYSGARSTLPGGGRSLHSDPWREGIQRLLTERHLNVGPWLRALTDEAFEEQSTTDGPEAEKGKAGGCSQPDISDPNPGAAYHPARRSRTQSRGGCNIARSVHQRPE